MTLVFRSLPAIATVLLMIATPVLADVFHTNRWDYVYRLQKGSTGLVEERKFTVIFDADGKLTTAISATEDYGTAVVVQADGKIIVVGETSTNGNDFAVLRYNADGSLDSSFGGGDGIVTTDFAGGSFDVAYRVVIQADGRIVVGGASGSGDVEASGSTTITSASRSRRSQ